MSELPIIDDPSLLDRVLRQFRIKGRIRPFDISPTAIPTFDIGQLSDQALDPTVVTTFAGAQGVRVGTANNAYLASAPLPIVSGDVFSATFTNPTAALVVLDTGQLGAGAHLMWIQVGWNSETTLLVEVQWRNAANDGTLATWFISSSRDGFFRLPFLVPFLATDERIRLVTPAAGTGDFSGNITIRPVNTSPAT